MGVLTPLASMTACPPIFDIDERAPIWQITCMQSTFSCVPSTLSDFVQTTNIYRHHWFKGYNVLYCPCWTSSTLRQSNQTDTKSAGNKTKLYWIGTKNDWTVRKIRMGPLCILCKRIFTNKISNWLRITLVIYSFFPNYLFPLFHFAIKMIVSWKIQFPKMNIDR